MIMGGACIASMLRATRRQRDAGFTSRAPERRKNTNVRSASSKFRPAKSRRSATGREEDPVRRAGRLDPSRRVRRANRASRRSSADASPSSGASVRVLRVERLLSAQGSTLLGRRSRAIVADMDMILIRLTPSGGLQLKGSPSRCNRSVFNDSRPPRSALRRRTRGDAA
jgi:hypothetical protein